MTNSLKNLFAYFKESFFCPLCNSFLLIYDDLRHWLGIYLQNARELGEMQFVCLGYRMAVLVDEDVEGNCLKNRFRTDDRCKNLSLFSF